MDRFQQIDATNSSIGALLYNDEEVVSLQSGVGLYDSREKALDQANGVLYLTSHRLVYIDDAQPHRHSCHLDLSLVKQTEYYAGFLKSSPKITLALAPCEAPLSSLSRNGSAQQLVAPSSPAPSRRSTSSPMPRDWRVNASAADPNAAVTNWICTICGFSNTSTSDTIATPSCQLCGVTRDKNAEATTSRPVEASIPTSLGDRAGEVKVKANGGDGHACPVCTFLNHPSMLACEMCGSSLSTESVAPSPSASSTPAPRKSTDVDANSLYSQTPPRSSTPMRVPADSVKLSFRRGGDKAFYALLKPTLKAKAWARKPSAIGSGGGATPDVDGRAASASKRRAGIDGILTTVEGSKRVQNDDMQGALKDLEALMAKAKQMVDFAEALNARLTRQEQAAEAPTPDQDAATLIRTSLVRLGLPAPAVTEDMARDQKEYHLELARELAGLLLGKQGLMGAGLVRAKGAGSMRIAPEGEGRGIIGLDEVWCVWNRARGIALVPPQALRAAAAYLPDLTSPCIQLRTFRSGLTVLHTPRYTDTAFTARLLTTLNDGDSTLAISARENAPILLMNELVETVELQTGLIVRDEGAKEGVLWYRNRFH